jgi:hypothetical protein
MPDRHRLIAKADVNPRFGTRRRTSSRCSECRGSRDPARFAFAHGGKDGTPFPVDRETYDRTIETMNAALAAPEVDRRERVDALKRLSKLAPTRAVPC